MNREEAQRLADRIRLLRADLKVLETEGVLVLTAEQRASFDAWADSTTTQLAAKFDVDTSDSQRHLSWGLKIVSTLGGLAFCAALMLFFARYWGYFDTWVQVEVVSALPLVGLGLTEFAARRERTLYFAGLMALVSIAAFVLDLSTLGRVFNMIPTEGALLAWGVFSLLLAYRYGLRLPLAAGLGLLLAWAPAAISTRMGRRWLDFGDQPELWALGGLVVFAAPLVVPHRRNGDFPFVYRVMGVLAFLVPVLILSTSGYLSYLPGQDSVIERCYEVLGLASAAGAMALGIRKGWTETVNLGAAFFALFLFLRLHHWWWDWMPHYLFFTIIGVIAVGFVLVFLKLRAKAHEVAA
ncbi:MAG: DUF2157 domain-containing protein [Acidobacteria bacterium]|nr:DUF2157 domain-containing protein [Acidobacteriota bacterium]